MNTLISLLFALKIIVTFEVEIDRSTWRDENGVEHGIISMMKMTREVDLSNIRNIQFVWRNK